MKKVMKKIISTLLVLTMVLVQIVPTTLVKADTVSGRGDEQKGSITIDNAIVDKTYTIYRIFDLESYSYDKDSNGNITNAAFVYKVASKWANFINQDTIKGVYVLVDENGNVTWKENASVSEFVKLAIEYAKAHGIENDGEQKATSKEVKFTNLTLGYYLVDSTVGSLCGLNTTKPDAIIKEKNDIPTISKEVDNNGTWDKESNAQIGDKVLYKTTITVKKGAENYVLTDTMTEGLTPNNDVVVKIGDTLVETKNYTITYENNGFVLKFKNEYMATLTENTVITVTYSATLNEKAVICKTNSCGHNDNKTYLEYGDNNKTQEDVTKTYTYEFTLIKTNSKKEQLEGAEFELYNKATGGEKILVFKVEDGVYRIAKTDEEKAKAETIKVGKAIILGLDSDKTYYLEEVEHPDGYNKLTSRAEVKVNPKTGTGDGVNVVEITKEVVNLTGAELPSTGGIGTVLFVSIGSLIVLSFGVLLVTKLRLSKMTI